MKEVWGELFREIVSKNIMGITLSVMIIAAFFLIVLLACQQ